MDQDAARARLIAPAAEASAAENSAPGYGQQQAKDSCDQSLVSSAVPHNDFWLYLFRELGRPDLIDRFAVASAGAPRDVALYRAIAPQNIDFDGSHKTYRIRRAFSLLVHHAP
jgi:hypothetical protein